MPRKSDFSQELYQDAIDLVSEERAQENDYIEIFSASDASEGSNAQFARTEEMERELASERLARRLLYEEVEALEYRRQLYYQHVASVQRSQYQGSEGSSANSEEDTDYSQQDGPNIDIMSYNQLIDLGDRIGHVKKDEWKDISKKYISNIPVSFFDHSSSAKKCVICLSDFQEGCTFKELPCNHCFHPSCIDQWLKENESCPLCKESIRKAD